MKVQIFLACCLVALATLSGGGSRLSGSAHAATLTTISFDDLSAGTIVSNQYDGEGVDFETGIIGLGVYCYPVIRQVAAGLAESGDQVADASCANGEFPDSSIYGVLTNSAKNVSLYAGFFPNYQNPAPNTDVTLTAYDVDGAEIASDTETVPTNAGTHTLLTVSSATANIVQFSLTDGDADIYLDDLTFDNPGGVPADFRIRAKAAELGVARGSAFDSTDEIDINRLNESTGNITFSAIGLPTGVTATFTPNPAGANKVSMDVKASSSAALTATYPYPTFKVTATPSSASVGPKAQSIQIGLDVFPPFTILLPSTIPVPPCSQVQVPVQVIWSLNPITFQQPFNGSIDLSLNGVPSDDQATLNPATVTPDTGTNSAKSTLTLNSQSDVSSSPSDLTISGTSGALTGQSSPSTVTRALPTVVGLTPGGGQTPQGKSLDEGTQVKILGHGFCPGTDIYFGNALAQADASAPTAGGTTIQASVPRLATTGKVYAVPANVSFGSTGTAASSFDFNVDSYRNTNGFAFDNSSAFQNSVGGWGLNDLSDIFGDGQVYYSINPCWPWGDCTISSPVPTLSALAFLGIVNAIPWDGHCFGFDLASQRLLHGDVPYSDFPLQPGKTFKTVWNLQGPDAPDGTPGASTDVAHYIHEVHIEQLSAEFLHYWLGEVEFNVAFGTQRSIIGQVVSALNQGDHPIVTLLNEGVSGLLAGEAHAVVAYGVEAGQNGDQIIDVYNPDAEFKTSEDQDAQGTIHQTAIENSQIVVRPDGHWSFKNLNFNGGPGSIVVVPYGTPPVQPTLPTSLQGLLTVVFGAASPTQVTDGSGHTLLKPNGATNTNHKTAIPDAARFGAITGGRKPPAQMFLFGKPGSYTETIVGTKSGAYHDAILGDHMEGSVSTDSTKGLTDSVSLVPSEGDLRFGRVGGTDNKTRPVNAQLLANDTDGSQRTVTIHTDMSTKGLTQMAFDSSRNAVSVQTGSKAMTYSLTLSWAGKNGSPQTFVTPTQTLSAGSTAAFTPGSWKTLASGRLAVSVKHRNGIVTHSTIRNTAPSDARYTMTLKVGKRGVRGKRKLTISVHIRHVAKGSSAVFAWVIVGRHKVLHHHTASLARRKVHGGTLTQSYVAGMPKGKPITFHARVTILSTTSAGSLSSSTQSRTRTFSG